MPTRTLLDTGLNGVKRMGEVVSITDRAGHSLSTPAPAGESALPDSPATYVQTRIGDALRNALEITDWVYATQCVHNEYADAVEDHLELVKAIEDKCRAIRAEVKQRNKRFFF